MASEGALSWKEFVRTAVAAFVDSTKPRLRSKREDSPDPSSTDSRLSYALASINDIQGTVRATDGKLNALIVIFSLPLTRLPDMTGVAGEIYNKSNHSAIAMALIAFIFVVWFAAFVIAVVGLSGTMNPGGLISGEKPRVPFFAEALYRASWTDLFLAPRALARTRFEEFVGLLSVADSNDLIRALVFEQMKLSIIRDVKLVRFRTASRLGLGNLTVAVLLYVLAYERGLAS